MAASHGKTRVARLPRAAGGESLAARAYRVLREQIVANELPPGFRALEEEIAFRLKMSRTPVREALVRLQFEGMVRIEPRRGVLVLPIAPQDMRHIYEVVTALETAAVELLCRRKLPREDLQPLFDAVDGMDAALRTGDREAWARSDDRFHTRLMDLCGNPRLTAIWLAQRDHVIRARLVTLHDRPLPLASNAAHRATLEAIAAGDPERARAVHQQQRNTMGVQLTSLLAAPALAGDSDAAVLKA
jgi:DNA-binding GntR family transcriptional regulator